MSTYIFFLSLNSIFSALLGSFVLYKKPCDPVNRTWFLMNLAVCSWSAFFLLMIITDSFSRANIYSRLCNISASYIAVFFTHFCFEITQTSTRKKLLLAIGYFNCLAISLLGFSNYFVSVRPLMIFKFYTSFPGPVYHYFTLHFFFFMLYAEIILLRSLKNLPEYKKNQINWIIVATACGYFTGGLSFLPVYGIKIEPFTVNFVWIYAAMISYAIVKHQVMDITVILRKGIIYSFLIGVTTAFYFIAVLIAGNFFQAVFGFRSLTSVLVIVTLLALCFKPLERKIQSLVDRYLFKKTPEMLQKENTLLLGELQKQDRLKAVATLAAGMAHEVKNPLTSIRTFAEYLPQKYDDPDFRQKFKRIVVDEVDRVNSIVTQLLEFSKPKELELKECIITDILDETLGFLSSNLLKNKIEVQKDYQENPSLWVDKNQLKQAFLNIFLNSIQAMPEGGVITVKTSKSAENFLIAISDTGCGISKENLNHLFDPFFTTKESGTGLGLSIVHGIITKHGGTIHAESELGKGTLIRISLLRVIK